MQLQILHWAVPITMEDTNITAQEILVLYVLRDCEKFLIQEDLHGKEGSNCSYSEEAPPEHKQQQRRKHRDD